MLVHSQIYILINKPKNMGNMKLLKIFSVLIFVLTLVFIVSYKEVSANTSDQQYSNSCLKYDWKTRFCTGSRKNNTLCKKVTYDNDCRQNCGNQANNNNYRRQNTYGNITWDWWRNNCPLENRWYDNYCRNDWWNQQNNKCCIYMYPILYGNNNSNPWPSYKPKGITYSWWDNNCPNDNNWYDNNCRNNEWNQRNNSCCVYMAPVLYGNKNNCDDNVRGITWGWWNDNCPRSNTWYDQYCKDNWWNQQNNNCCIYMYPKLYGNNQYCDDFYQKSTAYRTNNNGVWNNNNWLDDINRRHN
jgi:hypothetical protein